MKKRIISIIIMLAMFTAVWPCAVMANSENELISKLQSVTSDNIVKTYYDDFDSDGKNEMFAFVGKSNSSDPDLPTTLLGDIWFVSENNIEKIKSSKDVGGIGFIIGGDSEPQYIKQNDSLQFKFFNMWGNGQMRTTICTVKESKNVIVRDFDGYLKQSDNGFVLTHSTYDGYVSKDNFDKSEYYGSQRTWKYYWYYFDEGSNEFKEYGGTEITQEQFLQFNGARDILNLITEGQIYNILYRDNGIININIIKESGLYSNNDTYACSNILVGYDDNSVWTIDNQHADASDDYRSPIYSGFYLSALNPNIAVYPEFKKNIDIKVVFNGAELSFDQPPVILNDRVMIPIRAIFETMGYSVNWNQDTQTAVATLANNKIAVQLNNKNINYTVNSNSGTYICDVEPQIISNRILVPVRAIAESAGCKVLWDGGAKTVYID